MAKYFLDIQDNIAERNRLELTKRIRDLAFEASTNGIIVTGTAEEDFPIIHCNSAFSKMTGYKRAEVIGKNCRFLHGNDKEQKALTKLREALRLGKSFRGVLRNYKKDGTLFWNELVLSAVRDESGRLTHFIGVMNDITERKRTEDLLVKVHSELDFKVKERTAELVELNNKLKSEVDTRKRIGNALRLNVEQLSKKNRYEEIISTVTRAVHRSLDLNVVLDNAVDAIANNVSEADSVSIYFVEGKEAILQAHRGYSDWYLDKLERIPYPMGFTWKTIIEGSLQYSPDAEKDNVIGPLGKKYGTQSYASVPITYEEDTIGCLNIHSFSKNSFNEEELKLLELIATQIDIAVKNARQAEYLKEKLDELSKKNRYEEIISAVTRVVHRSLDLNDVLENAVYVISKNVEKATIVTTYIVEGEFAILKTHRGLTKDYIHRASKVPYGKGAIWHTIREGKCRYVPDVDEDDTMGDAGRTLGHKCFVAVPLFSSNEAVGVIFIASKEKNAFDDEEIKLLNIVSQQLGVAINNAKQAEALRKSEESLRISEEHYRLLVETTNVIPWEENASTRQLIYVGPQAEKLLGYPVERWYEQDFRFSHIHEDDRDRIKEGYSSPSATRKEYDMEYRMIASDDSVRWFHDVVSVISVNDIPKTLRGFMVDITERKKAEKELKENLEQISRKNRYEVIVSTVTKAVHRSRGLEEVLENAVEVMSRNIGVVDHVGIFFVEGEDAVMKAHRGYPDWFLKRIGRIPKPKGFTWACINEGKVIFCSDTKRDSFIGPAGKEAETKSYIAIPLKDGAQTIGCINVASLKKNAFDRDDISLLEVIAKQIEIAVNKSRDAESLRNSEERFRTIVENTYNLIIETDIFGNISYANPLHKVILGYDPAELIGKNCIDLVFEADREKIAVTFHQVATSGNPVHTARYRCMHKDGTLLWLESTGKAFRDANGVVRGVISSRNVTERKIAEDSRKEIEERYRTLVEHSYDIIVETTSDGRFSYINTTFTELLGYEESDVIGNRIFEYVHPDDKAFVEEEFSRAIRNFTSANFVYRIRNKTGCWRWLESSGRPFRTASGEIRASIATRDITERKESEEELKNAFSQIEKLKNQLEQENIYLQEEVKLIYHYGEILGESRGLKSALGLAEQVAYTESTVLLYGETGTGKELFAHAIHNMSPRGDRTMIIINCATLPPSLVEDELFGHEKGAFTGATSRRAGRFEIADGSTLFLDEVCELPIELQSKLLRVLQTGEFERIGGSETINVNTRIIAATNRDAQKAVENGSFREDLYYRLNVFPIYLPPLRDRREDIPILVEAFVKEFSEKTGKVIDKIPKKAMLSLINYRWPGNIRELRNVIERAVIISKDKKLNIDLPVAGVKNNSNTNSLKQSESKHILDVLTKTNWRIRGEAGAAELLGIKPTTLESKMRKLGIHRYKRDT